MPAPRAKPTVAWIADGLAHHAAGRLDAARAAFEAAARQSPGEAEPWRRLGLIAQQQGRFADSLAPTRRALALQRTGRDLSNYANALSRLGRHAEALEAAAEAAALDPRSAAAQANRGVALRALGRREEAAEAFRTAARLDPASAEAQANLGVALTDLGRLQEAEAALAAALSRAPTWAAGWFNLGNARLRRLDFAGAEGAYRRALALEPGHADAHANLAAAEKALGRGELALAHYAEAARLKPGDPVVAQNHALVLAELRRFPEAVAVYEAALAGAPRMASLHANLGAALQEWAKGQPDAGGLGLLDRAILAHLAALALEPGLLAARSNLGLALLARGRFEEAVVAFHDAVARAPEVASLHSNLAQCLADLKRLEEAEAACRRALALDAALPEAWSTLGNVLVGQRRHAEGEVAYRRALELKPGLAGGWCNLGVALFRQGRTAEADAAYAQAIALDPELADAHWNQALVKLQRGELASGFDQYEWRLRRPGRIREEAGRREPLWDGRELGGATILIYAEQGFGDAIQCVRFLPQVAARGGRVALQARAPLRRLFERAAGVERFVPDGEVVADAVWRLPLFSLPRLFASSLADLPGPVPYLSVMDELQQVWRERLEAAPVSPSASPEHPGEGRDRERDDLRRGRRSWVPASAGMIEGARPLRIGIVWSGNVASEVEQGRSIPLCAFAPLTETGAVLVSLQKGDGLEQVARAPFPLVDLGQAYQAGDFADTAAALLSLDGLVTCDTAIAHLAGALGVPTFLAISSNPDWRWLEDRDDSPWYPAIRLFRQRAGEDWGEVFSAMRRAL